MAANEILPVLQSVTPDMLPIDRTSLLDTLITCGVWYAILQTIIHCLYPLLAGELWQRVFGPLVAQRCPLLAQSSDMGRLSYLSTGSPKLHVVHDLPLPGELWRYFVRSFVRGGLWLGMFAVLFPEFSSSHLIFTAGSYSIPILYGLRIMLTSPNDHAEVTDQTIDCMRLTLSFIAGFMALDLAGLLH